ncbi:hypothetical protein B0T17DRAFT_488060 [Bombardia bombarda]|uniref:Nephrocystin 3-like N-terminal domain-containing protein n=1 Tax=Bombardia bombarda TaxID=252184 RepID=A0AA40C9A6_9PEZI|nr:hypothetical protein B0T17DRAFT_488060 [Bombardia bombarda]
MESIRAGLQESITGLSGTRKGHKSTDSVSVSVTPVNLESVSSDKTTTVDETRSIVSTTSRNHNTTNTTTTTSSIHLDRVAKTSRLIRGHIFKLGDYSESFFETLDLETYLEYISDERLIHMPRRGSDWDRVLKAAQFFGLQLWRLGSSVGQFCSGTEAASITALGSTKILLEFGPHQAQALMPTFQALYKLAILISHVSQIHDIFYASRDVKEAVAHLYCDMVELVGNISVHYRREISSLAANRSVTINFESAFGRSMTEIWKRRDLIVSKMWSLKLGNRTSGPSIDFIRRQLKAYRSVKGDFYDQVSENLQRAEDTCEWLKSPLVEFFRGDEKAMTITGDAGTGKTYLAGWIKERLQSPLDHTQYATLTYTFPYDAPSQCTPLAFLKGVLFQLLEQNVGDVSLYEKLGNALDAYGKHHSSSKLEAALWTALEAGFRTLNDRHANLVIIIDGLHELTGEQSPLEFHKALRACIGKFKTIRTVTLSKAISHLSDGCSHFTLTPQHLYGDIKTYFRQSFSAFSSFAQLSSQDKEVVVHELAQKAKASFIWAYLVIRVLAKEASTSTPEAFHKAVHTLTASLDDTLKRLLSKLSLKGDATQALLSYMLAANRPLLVAELAELLRLDIHHRRFGDSVDVPQLIKSTCGDIVIIENGKVHFKSKSICTYVQTQMGKLVPSLKDAHRNLTMALLLYAKLTLPTNSEPTFDFIGDESLEELFRSNALLQYVITHWQTHFRASSFYGTKGELVLTKEFHGVFPDSCHFTLLERSTSYYGISTVKLIERYEFSLKIQEACLGSKHVSVLQTLIILGNIHVTTSDALVGAQFFYRAAILGKEILSRLSVVVVTCTNYFLQYTETITITTRTEIVTCREQMILLMIDICKSKHGASSDLVIKWYKALAKLYVDIKEEYRATLIYKELYEVYVIRFGKKSPQARGLFEHLGGLDIVLKGEAKEKDIEEYSRFFFETTEELDVADERRVSILIRLAYFYESQSQWSLAEKIYITLWRRISEVCRIKATIELHITKLNIAIGYAKFLQKRKRVQEASNILICLWVEYEHSKFEEKAIIILIREVGVLFKAFGLLQVSISIFTKVWGWFKSNGKVTDEDAVQTSVLITEVVEEITETTVTTKTTTTTTTEVTETVVRDVYETHLTRCKKSKADLTFFNSCLAVVNLYMKLGNWEQAEVVIKQSLEITWKAILTAEVTIKLSEHFTSECITVATRLAVCYRHQGFFEKAESIYLRIFHACLVSLQVEDVRVEETLAVLIQFYEEHHRHEKVIEIYTELLAKYRKSLGHSHELTIKTLYALAAHYRLLGRSEAYTYYIEIVTVLNKHSKQCHRDAFEAALILVTYYHERKHWAELRAVCAVLWEAFVHHHKDYPFTEETVQLIYEKYTYVLEYHAKVELSVLYEISVKFRETVTVVFGASASILIVAMIALAKICERDEKHHHESITIYEEVIKRITTTKTTTTVVTETTITTVKKRLAKVYVTIITSGSGSNTTTTTVERAIAISLEVYAQLKVEFGCWHEKTLLKLKDIIILYQKLAGKESHGKIVELLQVAFVEIITANCGSMGHYHAAATLASIYITAGLVKTGLKLVHHLRHLIIFSNDFEVSREIVVQIDKSLSRVAFVFLVSFEQHLMEKVVMTYSELMAATLLEVFLYEQYKNVVVAKAQIEVILEYGAKLRAFWVEQKQDQMIVVLDRKLFELFKVRYSAVIKTHDDHTRIFYLALLASLGEDHAKVDFAALACKAGNAKAATLVKAGEFKNALEVAKCTFSFASKLGYYGDLQRVQFAYQLAELMAGIDVQRPGDATLWAEYLKLSREITTEALAIFRANKVDFVRLRFEDLGGIVRLLGSQQNYGELEALLLKLWQSREVQRTWDATRVLSVGRFLVHAHAAAKNISAAIEICDTMCYNLRHSRGSLDPVTVEMTQMLAALYTSDNRVDRAMALHEQILREIEAAVRDDEWHQNANFRGKNGHQHSAVKPEDLAKTASWQLELLKRAHSRLGGWTKSEQEFSSLYARLHGHLGKAGLDVPAPDTWAKAAVASKNKPDDMVGKYVGPREWEWQLGGSSVVNGDQHTHNGNGNGTLTVAKGAKGKWGIDHIRVASQEWLAA